jgi:hypothetical protein
MARTGSIGLGVLVAGRVLRISRGSQAFESAGELEPASKRLVRPAGASDATADRITGIELQHDPLDSIDDHPENLTEAASVRIGNRYQCFPGPSALCHRRL